MRRITKIASAAVLSAALTVPAVFAQTGGQTSTGDSLQTQKSGSGQRFREGRRGMRGTFAQLDLTADQKAQIRQIRESNRGAVADLAGQLRSERKQMMQEATRNGTFDESIVSQRLAALAPLQAKLMAQRFKERQQIEAVLTPEQKSKLEALRSQNNNGSAQRGWHGARRS